MHYIILIYGDEKNFAMMSDDPKAKADMYAAFMRYGADMQAAGVLRGGAELKPTHSATTVRVRNGKTVTTDGPFAETKEQLGGFYLIDVPQPRRRGPLGGALSGRRRRLDRGPAARPDAGRRQVDPSIDRTRPAEGSPRR